MKARPGSAPGALIETFRISRSDERTSHASRHPAHRQGRREVWEASLTEWGVTTWSCAAAEQCGRPESHERWRWRVWADEFRSLYHAHPSRNERDAYLLNLLRSGVSFSRYWARASWPIADGPTIHVLWMAGEPPQTWGELIADRPPSYHGVWEIPCDWVLGWLASRHQKLEIERTSVGLFAAISAEILASAPSIRGLDLMSGLAYRPSPDAEVPHLGGPLDLYTDEERAALLDAQAATVAAEQDYLDRRAARVLRVLEGT